MIRGDAGLAALTTTVVLPLLLVVVAGVLQLGALRVSIARARAAADLAALIAVNDQDDASLASTGALRLAANAADVAREHFARELALSAPLLGETPAAIAARAEIAVYPAAPSIDARTGARYEHPTIRIAADIPIRTPVFGALVFTPITTVHVVAASAAR
jgi:Flp pilus assembly protein TadG